MRRWQSPPICVRWALGFAYMTYDLTNLATLRGWPITLVVVDIAWGTVLAASVATASYFIGTRIFGS